MNGLFGSVFWIMAAIGAAFVVSLAGGVLLIWMGYWIWGLIVMVPAAIIGVQAVRAWRG